MCGYVFVAQFADFKRKEKDKQQTFMQAWMVIDNHCQLGDKTLTYTL